MGPNTATRHPIPASIAIVATLMILFGGAEVVTGFSHSFFGLVTAESRFSTFVGAAIGFLYLAAGMLVLTMRSWAAALAVVFLALDVVGRISLVLMHAFPVDSFKQQFSMTAGTLIVVLFGAFIVTKRRAFT